MAKKRASKKTSLHYELYGSEVGTHGGGIWRWSIFAGKEKRPLLVGSFYGSLPDAKKHAEAAIKRLKLRIQNRKKK